MNFFWFIGKIIKFVILSQALTSRKLTLEVSIYVEWLTMNLATIMENIEFLQIKLNFY